MEELFRYPSKIMNGIDSIIHTLYAEYIQCMHTGYTVYIHCLNSAIPGAYELDEYLTASESIQW